MHWTDLKTPHLSPGEWIALVALSVAALVLSSLDQCTRGPSLTALFLTHLNQFF